MKLQAINSTKLNQVNKTSFKGYETKVKNDGEKIVEFYAPPYDKEKYSATLVIVPLKQGAGGAWEVDGGYHRDIKSKSDKNGKETGKFELTEDRIACFVAGDNISGAKAFGYKFKFTPKDSTLAQKIALEPGLKTYNGDTSKGEIYNVYIDRVGSVKKNGPMYHMLPDSYYNVKWATNAPKQGEVRNHVNMFGGNIEGVIDRVKAGKLDNYGLLMTTPLFGKDDISSHGYWPTNPFQISSTRGTLQDFKNLNVELYKRGVQYVADGAFTSQGLLSPFIQHIIKHGKDSQYADFFKIDNLTNSQTGTFNINIPILPDTKTDLENIRYKIVQKDGEEYIQFYDKRLVKQQDVENKNEFIKSYDPELLKKFPNINTHEHTITPYYFDITNENKNYLLEKIYPNAGEPISDMGIQFNNFAVVKKSNAGGVNSWDGNLDLIKMNTSNKEVREYLYNIANYWTKTIANTLLVETALLNSKDSEQVKQIALKNGISEADLAEIKKNIENDEYTCETFENIKETENLIEQEVLKFPLESIELFPEITAVLASPNMGANNLSSLEGKKLAEYYGQAIQGVNTLLQQLDKELQHVGGEKIYTDETDSELTEYGAVIAKVIIPEAVKYFFAAGILGRDNVDFGENGVVIKDNNVTLSKIIGSTSTTPDREEDELVKHLVNSKSPLGDDIKKIAKVYTEKFKNVSHKDLLLAQAIIDKSGAGLNWRYDAAKDIADLDAVRGNMANFDSAFDVAVDFWKNFTDEIKKENPNAFTIGELTCLDEFANKALGSRYVSAEVAERQFYEKTGITTGSNYSYLYSAYPQLLDRDTERGFYDCKTLDGLKEDYSRFYKAGTLPFINNSHVFTDNHDKPRTMHGFVFNTEILLSDIETYSGKPNAAAIRESLGLNPDDDFISSRGLAGYDLFKRAIENSELDKNDKDNLKASLLMMLKGDESIPDEERKMRSKALGTRPVEVTLELLLDKAGIKETDKRKEISDKLNGYIFEQAFDKYTTLWRMMVAGAGVPTLFNGDEFGQTGYETPTKNQDLGCRNRVLLERENSGDMFSALYKEVTATSNLHKQKGMSALAGGTTEIAEIKEFDETVGDKQVNTSMVAYKYDSQGSEVLSLFYKPARESDRSKPNSEFSSKETIKKPELSLRRTAQSSLGGTVGILSTGTKEFKRKEYIEKEGKYIDSDETYIMENGVLRDKEGNPIEINVGVNIFYRVK
ncbi:hypothetical protein IKA15_04895 [bacterium]|nr:hypothetical protein [bacterium]